MTRIAALFALAFVFAPGRPVYGPPLLCQPLDIGDAKSLPWGKDPFDVDPSFAKDKLVSTTLEILEATEDPLVHMETLRRAAIYSSQFDEKSAAGTRAYSQALALRLHDRALRAAAAGKSEPVLWLDAGYLIEALGETASRPDIRGREYVEKACSLRPEEAAFHLAVANVALEHGDRELARKHFKAGLMKSPEGSLARKNVVAFAQRYYPEALGKGAESIQR